MRADPKPVVPREVARVAGEQVARAQAKLEQVAAVPVAPAGAEFQGVLDLGPEFAEKTDRRAPVMHDGMCLGVAIDEKTAEASRRLLGVVLQRVEAKKP